MVELEYLLKGYFHYDEDMNENYLHGLANFYANSKAVIRVESERFKLKAYIGHINVTKKYTEAVCYIPDNHIVRRSEEKCFPPLQFVQSCNYSYYGCYMSIACYLHDIEPDYISLIQPVDNHAKYSLKYRPELAKVFLRNRLESLRAMERAVGQREEQSINPVLELYS